MILGFFTPIGALALAGTMGVAAYHHILTSGFNIYVLELVVLYLGGSLAILLNGPGRFSFDAGIVSGLLGARLPQSSTGSFSADANGSQAVSGSVPLNRNAVPAPTPSSL